MKKPGWLERVNKLTKYEEDCWIYTGCPTRLDVYGSPRIMENYIVKPLSHWSYIHFKGPITIGMKILHTCDRPRCWNPEHLYQGTHQQNMDDMVQKNRSLKGERHNCVVLTE